MLEIVGASPEKYLLFGKSSGTQADLGQFVKV